MGFKTINGNKVFIGNNSQRSSKSIEKATGIKTNKDFIRFCDTIEVDEGVFFIDEDGVQCRNRLRQKTIDRLREERELALLLQISENIKTGTR